MSLVTRCPKCHSDFVVKLEQLQALDGLVRCGECAHIFNGFEALQSQLPTLTQRPGMGVSASSSAPATTSAPTYASTYPSTSVSTSTPSTPSTPPSLAAQPSVLRHRAERGERTEPLKTPEPRGLSEPFEPTAFSLRSAPETSPVMIAGEARLRGEGPSVGRTQPEFLVDEVDTPRLMMLLWSLASVLALALVVVQLAYIYRNDLATHFPSLRPALESLCGKLKCEVSLRRHLERISVSVVSFERQSGGSQEGKAVEMTLRFSLRNRFNQAQPWPDLSLELTDASGTVVLRKRLRPNEYLPAALVDKPFAASQEVNLVLPVTVTGLQINGYTLKPFFP